MLASWADFKLRLFHALGVTCVLFFFEQFSFVPNPALKQPECGAMTCLAWKSWTETWYIGNQPAKRSAFGPADQLRKKCLSTACQQRVLLRCRFPGLFLHKQGWQGQKSVVAHLGIKVARAHLLPQTLIINSWTFCQQPVLFWFSYFFNDISLVSASVI